jgi:hypothetical protein
MANRKAHGSLHENSPTGLCKERPMDSNGLATNEARIDADAGLVRTHASARG